MRIRSQAGRAAMVYGPRFDAGAVEGLRVVGIYSGIIVAAEFVGVFVTAIAGAIIDAALIPILLAHFVRREEAQDRRLLPVLAVLALLRTLSIAAVVPRLPEYLWYALIGLPLLVGIFLAVRLIDQPLDRLALRIRRPLLDVALALTGIQFGLLGYLFLEPPALVVRPDVATLIAELAILAVFGAFVEELLFRGLLQTVAIEAFGFQRAGVAYAAAMSACLYLGSGSILFTLEMGLLGAIYGAALLRGASLWGLAIGHAILLWSMAIVWPAILG